MATANTKQTNGQTQMIYQPFGCYPLNARNIRPYDIFTNILWLMLMALAVAALITVFTDPYYADFLRSIMDHGDCTGCL